MTTQEMKDKGTTCRGRGFNCPNCKEKYSCVEYEEVIKKTSNDLCYCKNCDVEITELKYKEQKEMCDFCYSFDPAAKKESKAYIKPPLGIEPKCIWKARRINSLKDAIDRYLSANLKVPCEWIEEYNSALEDDIYK